MVAIRRLFSRFSLDALGFSASVLCAIHCAVLPLVFMMSSYAGGLIHNHSVENAILVFSFLAGSVSLIPSYFKHHRKLRPLLIFSGGIVFIIISRFAHGMVGEAVLTTCGAMVVATSHWINWSLCRPYHEGRR